MHPPQAALEEARLGFPHSPPGPPLILPGQSLSWTYPVPSSLTSSPTQVGTVLPRWLRVGLVSWSCSPGCLAGLACCLAGVFGCLGCGPVHFGRQGHGLVRPYPRVFRTSEFAVILRSSLHFQVLVHGLLRGPVSDCGMKTLPIIAQLDVARGILMRCPTCRVDGTVHPLDFQRAIERFCERVVIALTGQRHLDRPFGPPVNIP
jgi:hypothetical protein